MLTDVHETWQLKEASIVDVLQIAFLCRQTDLLTRSVEIANLLDKKVNIKKGQFLTLGICILSKTGTENVWITEEGQVLGIIH